MENKLGVSMIIIKPLYRFLWKSLTEKLEFVNSLSLNSRNHCDESLMQLTRSLLLIRGDLPMALHIR